MPKPYNTKFSFKSLQFSRGIIPILVPAGIQGSKLVDSWPSGSVWSQKRTGVGSNHFENLGLERTRTEKMRYCIKSDQNQLTVHGYLPRWTLAQELRYKLTKLSVTSAHGAEFNILSRSPQLGAEVTRAEQRWRHRSLNWVSTNLIYPLKINYLDPL